MESRNWLICGVLFIMCTMCSHVNAEINSECQNRQKKYTKRSK